MAMDLSMFSADSSKPDPETRSCQFSRRLSLLLAFLHRPVQSFIRSSNKQKERDREKGSERMAVMDKLKMLVVQEPVVAASLLIAGFGLFLPAVVRPMLDSMESSKQVPPPDLKDVVAGMTGKQ